MDSKSSAESRGRFEERRDNKSTAKSIGGFGKAGWGIVIYCAAMFWFYVGMVNDGTNITAPAVAAKIGVDASVVVSMGTVAGLVSFLFFILYGQINRKIGSRYTSAICMAIAGLAYIGLGMSNGLVQYAVCLCFVSGSAMSGGYIAGGSLVAQWFPKKKGIVMGYTTMGHNLASAFYVPLISTLVTRLGVEKAVVFPAIMVICLGAIGFLFVRNTPQDRGLYPDNVTKDEYEKEYDVSDVKDDGGWTTQKLLMTKEFWLAAVTTGLYQLVTVGIMSQLVTRNMQLGFTQGEAVMIMTVLACIGVVGSWAFGVIDQKMGTKKSMLAFGGWYIIALIANVIGDIYQIQAFVYLSVFMIGMAIGGSANFTTSLPAAIFGRHGFEKVNSVIFPVQGLVTSLNFLLSGISLGLTGSLRGSYMFNIGVIVVNIILINMVNEHKYNRDFKVER